VSATILIYEALRKRNLKGSLLSLWFLAPKYASKYKEITRKEAGRTDKTSTESAALGNLHPRKYV